MDLIPLCQPGSQSRPRVVHSSFLQTIMLLDIQKHKWGEIRSPEAKRYQNKTAFFCFFFASTNFLHTHTQVDEIIKWLFPPWCMTVGLKCFIQSTSSCFIFSLSAKIDSEWCEICDWVCSEQVSWLKIPNCENVTKIRLKNNSWIHFLRLIFLTQGQKGCWWHSSVHRGEKCRYTPDR